MHTIVPEIARAVVEHPSPGTFDDRLIVGALRRRPLPQIVVDARRRRAIRRQLHRAGAPGLPGPACDHFSQCAAFHKLPRLVQKWSAADLSAHLHDAFLFARRGHGHPAFLNVMTRRLLHIHILAGQTALDGEQRMPVIRCRHHEGINRGIAQQFAIILHQFRHPSCFGLHLRPALRQYRLAHIAEMSHLAVRLSDEAVHDRIAAPANADACHGDFGVWRYRPRWSQHRGGGKGAGRFQKSTAGGR